MRLLLDEHLSPKVAAELRKIGIDAVSLIEDEYSDVQGMSDDVVFERAVSEDRAFVTYNYADFAKLHRDFVLRGRGHFGIVLVPRGKIPSSDKGAQVRALSGLCSMGENVEDQMKWLEPA